MRKIKSFKLTLRPHVIKQRAKKAGIDLATADLAEVALAQFLERASKSLAPGVVFDTFGPPDTDQALLAPMPGLAYSLILAGLGVGFSAMRSQESSLPEKLWPILEEHALEEAVRFASALIADEAEKENCELSPFNAIAHPAALAAALRKLDAETKLGITFDGGRLHPATSLMVSQSWLAKSKAKGRK